MNFYQAQLEEGAIQSPFKGTTNIEFNISSFLSQDTTLISSTNQNLTFHKINRPDRQASSVAEAKRGKTQASQSDDFILMQAAKSR